MACLLIFSMAWCMLFVKRIDSGTEAAKLLLASERLDEGVVGGDVDIGLFGRQQAISAEQYRNELSSLVELSDRSGSYFDSATGDSAYTWSSFPKHSHSLESYTQFMSEVEQDVSRAAEDIAHMKNNVGVTDKWVRVGFELQMLRVFDSYDMLLVLGMHNDTNVYYRYTDESAKNVYELFSFMSYDDGTTGEIRTMLIPGERYERMYNNSNGYTDYFIAENSRGYWMSTRFSYYEDNSGNITGSFTPCIVKDGIGYGAFLTFDELERSEGSWLENAWYSVFDPVNDRELFRIIDGESNYYFYLYLNAIRSGLVSVSANDVTLDDDGIVSKVEFLNTLRTQNGVYTAIGDYNALPRGEFGMIPGQLQYLYNDDIYYGTLQFAMKYHNMPIYDACLEFEDYAETLGLSLYCDMEAVAVAVEHASLLAESFEKSFTWNGYKMQSIANFKNARDTLQDQFDKARGDYEAVRDYETVDFRQMLSEDAHFAALITNTHGDNTFAGRLIRLSGITVLTNDIALFEEGVEYVLCVGLSLLDEAGNPISVNTIALSGAAPVGVQFGGGSITLSASGDYELPLNLGHGNYAAVVYIATKDEGIRVSEIEKIAFLEIEEGEIESSAMHIEASEEDSNLIVKYDIKNSRHITLAAKEEGYTYDEVRKSIMVEILSYGSPYHGAVLEHENGEAVAEDATLGVGGYRMLCYFSTSDGIAEGYVYLNIE